MVRREDAQPKFGAGGRIGRIGGCKFQVAGVLDGQNMFVGIGGVGGFYGGGLFGVALAGLPRGGAGGKSAAHGDKVLRLGIRPAFEFHGGQIRVVLHRSQNGVGAAQHGGQFVRIVDANLKFLMQFHGLAGKSEPGGFARLAHAVQQVVEIFLLPGGEVAGFAPGCFLAGNVRGQLAQGGGRFGEIAVGQARDDVGIFLRGAGDEVAVVGDGWNWAMRFMVHGFVSC